MKENFKRNTGITLIALVITIIVLLILAGISISFVIGNNGIITQAQNAVITTRKATAKEEVEMAYAACESAYYEAWTKDQSIDREAYIKAHFKEHIGTTGSLEGEISIEDGVIKGTYRSNNQGTEYNFRISEDGIVSFGGILNEEVTVANYGDPVNYAIDLNGNSNTTDDWSIFFKDEKGTYIIANKYLPTEKVPEGAGMSKNPPYVAYWSSGSLKDKEISSEIRNIFRLNYKGGSSSGSSGSSGSSSSTSSGMNDNMKAVATLMDTEAWKTLVPSNLQSQGVKAIGGPTLEMWIESWNEQYPLDSLYYAEEDYGYKWGNNEGNLGHVFDTSSLDGYDDDLYFPYHSAEQSCYAYWLASPSRGDSYGLVRVSYDGCLYGNYYNYAYYGLRPLVYLPSSINGELGTDGVWNIQ